jgi:hypothetical protein
MPLILDDNTMEFNGKATIPETHNRKQKHTLMLKTRSVGAATHRILMLITVDLFHLSMESFVLVAGIILIRYDYWYRRMKSQVLYYHVPVLPEELYPSGTVPVV